jgi:Lamin Tail Domain
MSAALARSILISDFTKTYYVKPSYRIIIDHINHNPRGKHTLEKLNEEFVVLENEGTEKVSLAGWSLTDETTTGAGRHVYKFPQTVTLSPREKVYVHTGPGEDSFEKGTPPKWNLHWGRHSFVWNNEGDTATLFDAEGNKVDSLQVVSLKPI